MFKALIVFLNYGPAHVAACDANGGAPSVAAPFNIRLGSSSQLLSSSSPSCGCEISLFFTLAQPIYLFIYSTLSAATAVAAADTHDTAVAPGLENLSTCALASSTSLKANSHSFPHSFLFLFSSSHRSRLRACLSPSPRAFTFLHSGRLIARLTNIGKN